MSLTNAILTGFTGITTNQVAVDTIGNNVANVNTTAFKSSRAMFETLFVRTVEEGTAPAENTGGTNPLQVGYGGGVATIQRSFNQGVTQQTGVESDLAIDGDGFFILEGASSTPVYTRAGAFSLNTENELVAPDGSFVQGFGASSDGTIDTGLLTNLTIPVGEETEAGATTAVRMVGNFNAGSAVAATGALAVSAPMLLADGSAASAGSALTSLVDTNGDALFSDADVVAVSGVRKGDIDVPETEFIVGSTGSTLGDLAGFLQSALAIDTGADAIDSPGVTIGDGTMAPAGALVIQSNAGDVHAISVDATSIRNSTTGSAPFTFTTTPATGEGLTTTFQVFDSLGTPVDVRLRLVLESKDDTGTLWRFNVESGGDPAAGAFVGEGMIKFDQNGKYTSDSGSAISVGRTGSGAVTPLSFSVDFSTLTSLRSEDGTSTLQLASQDGFPAGTLTAYEIDPQGVITGTFDNGQQRVFGQVALATFANNMGLVGQSENTFVEGVNSGPAMIGEPRTGSAGRINARQLEQANVDLSRELVNLIVASTGFSAASRTVRTADDMLQELLLLVR